MWVQITPVYSPATLGWHTFRLPIYIRSLPGIKNPGTCALFPYAVLVHNIPFGSNLEPEENETVKNYQNSTGEPGNLFRYTGLLRVLCGIWISGILTKHIFPHRPRKTCGKVNDRAENPVNKRCCYLGRVGGRQKYGWTNEPGGSGCTKGEKQSG